MTDPILHIGDIVYHIATPEDQGIITDIDTRADEITVRWRPAAGGATTMHPVDRIHLIRRQAKTHQEHNIT